MTKIEEFFFVKKLVRILKRVGGEEGGEEEEGDL
jgi:hypothetical protein